MPHGGYHGTIKIGGNVVQQGDGQGGIIGGIDDRSRLDFNPPQSNQNNQTAAQLQQQIENQMAADSDPRSAYIAAQANAGILSNLLRKEQEENLANQVAASFAKGNVNKSDFTGNEGDKTFLGMNLGSEPTAAATVINPITGEKIITRKVREGMTSPEYAQYMSGLYNLNPTLMEETFPVASGQALKPLLVRIGEGIMELPGASQMGQLASSMISPVSGLFTGKSTATPKIQYDNMGNAINIIPQISDGGGDQQAVQAVPEGMDMSIYGSFIGKPGPFTADFIDQDQDGVDDRFQSGPGEAQAPPYSVSEQPADFKLSSLIGLPALTDYASMGPQFTGSQYTNQGVSPEFLENLRRYYG